MVHMWSNLAAARFPPGEKHDKAVDVKQVSREPGVRYVLKGSVRRAGPSTSSFAM